jgi:hypothetical protein
MTTGFGMGARHCERHSLAENILVLCADKHLALGLEPVRQLDRCGNPEQRQQFAEKVNEVGVRGASAEAP